MGLLDDAIREHLDLKRRRGADPGEIERLEREALGPVRREPRSSAAVPHLEVEPDHLEPAYDPHHDDRFDEDPLAGEPHREVQLRANGAQTDQPVPTKRGFLRRTRPASLSASGPVDFEQHLAAHAEHPEQSHAVEEHHEESAADAPPLTFNSPPPPRPRFDADSPREAEDDHANRPVAAAPSAPDQAPQPDPEANHGGETHEWDVEHAFANEDSPQAPPSGTSEEDVLEETPEFLQDTPDHDRLWFEQRPPRDFDFDG